MEDSTPTTVGRDELIEVLTRHVARFYDVLQSEGGATKIIEIWTQRSSYSSGKIVRAVLNSETITGVTDGLEENGALRIKRSDGSVTIVQAGDVEQVRAAT
jgi:biotin-(acetyl-CoA carboxylase) ligase